MIEAIHHPTGVHPSGLIYKGPVLNSVSFGFHVEELYKKGPVSNIGAFPIFPLCADQPS